MKFPKDEAIIVFNGSETYSKPHDLCNMDGILEKPKSDLRVFLEGNGKCPPKLITGTVSIFEYLI